MDGACRVDGCDRPTKVKKESLCGLHYARLRRHGDPTAWKKPVLPVCSVVECDLRAVAFGLCDRHYRRQKRYGTTDVPTRPTVCAVDGCDRKPQALSLCDRHYRRKRKGGDGARYCRHCGQTLDPNLHATRVYCSKACQERAMCIQRREEHRRRWLKRYGLTVAAYDALLVDQGGRCAICRTDEPGGHGTWHVDHCHDSGHVRGLLCRGCNIGLGQFKDDPRLLEAAVRYLSATVGFTP